MAARRSLRKAVDDAHRIRCKSGSFGVLREEVYVNLEGAIVKYNLAFIHFGICQTDHGRVLGYDNGVHERHWMGDALPAAFHDYERTLSQFHDEVEALKEQA